MKYEPNKYYTKYKNYFGDWDIMGPYDSYDEAWCDFGGDVESIELGKDLEEWGIN